MLLEAEPSIKHGGVVEDLTERPSPEDWEVLAGLQEFGIPKEISPRWAIFNTSFIPSELGTILLSRAVDRRKIRPGEPDRNSLQVSVLDQSHQYQRLPDLLLPIEGDIVNWEDARVGPDGRTLGFTVVFREGDSYEPYPALVEVEIEDNQLKVVGKPDIFKDKPGKNAVPLEDGFFYRPDGVSHELHYLNSKREIKKTIDFSEFKNNGWISKKIGAVARPIELDDGSSFLLIHGVSANVGRYKYVYSLGIAVLDQEWSVRAVSKEPLLQREDFLKNLHLAEDLNPEKKVVYLCDYQVNPENEDDLILPVNVGDRITVFKHVSLSDLKDQAKSLLYKVPRRLL